MKVSSHCAFWSEFAARLSESAREKYHGNPLPELTRTDFVALIAVLSSSMARIVLGHVGDESFVLCAVIGDIVCKMADKASITLSRKGIFAWGFGKFCTGIKASMGSRKVQIPLNVDQCRMSSIWQVWRFGKPRGQETQTILQSPFSSPGTVHKTTLKVCRRIYGSAKGVSEWVMTNS